MSEQSRCYPSGRPPGRRNTRHRKHHQDECPSKPRGAASSRTRKGKPVCSTHRFQQGTQQRRARAATTALAHNGRKRLTQQPQHPPQQSYSATKNNEQKRWRTCSPKVKQRHQCSRAEKTASKLRQHRVCCQQWQANNPFRRNTTIRDEHKAANQPVKKIWMALQPSREWHAQQQLLKQQEQQSTAQQAILPAIRQATHPSAYNASMLRIVRNMEKTLHRMQTQLACKNAADRHPCAPTPRIIPLRRIGGLLMAAVTIKLEVWVHETLPISALWNKTSQGKARHDHVRLFVSEEHNVTIDRACRCGRHPLADTLEIQRCATRWRCFVILTSRHQLGNGVFAALRRAATRWKLDASRFSAFFRP